MTDKEKSSGIHTRFAGRVGEWQSWMDVALDLCPDALEAPLELGYGREAPDGLSSKERELLFLAAWTCPAMADADAAGSHTRQALKLGATPEEIVQTVKVAGIIGLHPVVEGMPQLRAILSAG